MKNITKEILAKDILSEYKKSLLLAKELFSELKKHMDDSNRNNKSKSEQKPSKTSQKYNLEFEEICRKILEFFFFDDLQFKDKSEGSQERNSKGNNNIIPDIVAIIKNTERNIWNLFYYAFNSYIVVFDAKNYNKEIGQDQLYLATKYLSKNFRRNIVFLCTRQNSENKKDYILISQSILRESGFIVLELNIYALLNEYIHDLEKYVPTLETAIKLNKDAKVINNNTLYAFGASHLEKMVDEFLLKSSA